jgi:hypothetical protein
MDLAGNENSTSVVINLDTSLPTTDCLIDGTMGKNGWYRSGVTVTLLREDNGSGMNYTMYSINNESWQVYDRPFTVAYEGVNNVTYWSVDKVNNTEEVKSVQIKIDTRRPVISAWRLSEPNSNGWYNSNVTAYARIDDPMPGSNVTNLSLTKIIGEEGYDRYVLFNEEDIAGNPAIQVPVRANIDQTVPNTTCKLDGVRGSSGWYGSDTKVSFSVADVPGASIATYFRYVGSDQNLTYSGPFTITSPGEYTIKYYSIDGAGNKESERSTSFKIDKTLPVITCMVNGTMGSDGWYRSDVIVSFNASDPGPSGLARAEYSLDGTSWKPIEMVTLSNEGLYSIRYRATNNAGTQVNGERSIGIIKTPPRIASYTPESEASGVFVDSQVTVNFEGRLNASTVTPESFYLTDGSERVDAIVRCDENGTAVLQPLSGLWPETTYTAYVTEGVKDLAGNSVAGAPEWSFTTGSYSSSGEVTVTIRPPTPTPAPTATPVPRPTTEATGLGWLPIALGFIAIVVIGGAVALYVFVIRK